MNRRLSFFLLLGCAAVALAAVAAEPEADPAELRRVPPTEPARALATFRVKPGFRLDLVAAEPRVVDPIALAFDEDSRLYVVEMRDYSERRPERLGRVRRLVDADGDGVFEQSTVFADGLPWPTAVACWAGGVFIGSTPDIFFCKDTDGDGVADVREKVFTGFASDFAPFATNKLNVQALMNSFAWGPDNRIHGAASFSGGKVERVASAYVERWVRGQATPPARVAKPASPRPADGRPVPPNGPVELRGRDFSFDPRTLDFRAESGGGQHGMSFDNAGRKFVCANSSHIQLVMYEERHAGRHPHYAMPRALVDIAADGGAAPVFRLSPDEPWRVIRTRWRVAGEVPGPIEGGGRASGYFTGATGITLYRGDALGEEFVGDAFVADCGSNLIHRKKLRPDGASLRAERPADEAKTEFLASTDNWFRPVQMANGPDGALYLADMYREVIEHPWSLPPGLKKHLDLNSGNDRGRIYRVVREKFTQSRPPHLGGAAPEELVKLLAHPNGWHRDTAARLLCERGGHLPPAVTAALREMVTRSPSALGRLHALRVGASLHVLSHGEWFAALGDAEASVQAQACRLGGDGSLGWTGDEPAPRAARSIAARGGAEVCFQLALGLATAPGEPRVDCLRTIARRHGGDRWVQAAVLNSSRDVAPDLFAALVDDLRTPRAMTLGPLGAELARLTARQARGFTLSSAARAIEGIPVAEWRLLTAARFLEGLRESGQSPADVDENGQLGSWFDDAGRVAAEVRAPIAERMGAVRVLAFAPGGEPPPVLATLLEAAQPPELQSAALTELGRFGGSRVAEEVVRRWTGLSPSLRSGAMELLLKRTERAAVLLAAVERGVVRPQDFSTAQAQFLRTHRDAALRERAAKALGRAPEAARASVVAAFDQALSLRGDATKGRATFHARCASCHKLGGDGHTLGPDLATVQSGGREKLLISILDPNREVAPNFHGYVVETRDGDSLSGVLAGETTAAVTLRQAGGVEITVPRAGIVSFQNQGRSLMPEGLEEGLTAQDLADLMEFILVR